MLFEIGLALFSILGLFYWRYRVKCKYWIDKGVFQIEPTFPFGSFFWFFLRKESLVKALENQAKKAKDLPFYGAYFLNDPVFVVNDPDLVKFVLIKDFDYFVNRNPAPMSKMQDSKLLTDKIWMEQMTGAEGQKWKNIRTTFTPIFTTGKMKAMMIFMQETCKRLIVAFEEMAEKKKEFEIRGLTSKFSMDTIASCAFGVDAQAFTNPDSEFATFGSRVLSMTITDALKFGALFLPYDIGFHILQFFGLAVFKDKETQFFYNVVLTTLKHRRETKTRRNDLIDMMVDAIKGDIQHDQDSFEDQFEKDAKIKTHAASKKGDFDEITIVATAFVILVAGYDTTGSTLAFACYQLAKNPHVQDKLRQEIDDIIKDDPQREINYEDLKDMKYLEQVLSETMRFHNPLVFLQRTVTKEYKVPGHDLILPKDQTVFVNVPSIHNNPKHYANPNIFDPEHFSPSARAKRHPCAFLPFGQGPRGCIGMRFAMTEAKLALANIIRKFTLIPSTKTQEPIIYSPESFISYAKDGLYIKVEKIN